MSYNLDESLSIKAEETIISDCPKLPTTCQTPPVAAEEGLWTETEKKRSKAEERGPKKEGKEKE